MCVPIAENHWIIRNTVILDEINSKQGLFFLVYHD